jgi:hypothetical protein
VLNERLDHTFELSFYLDSPDQPASADEAGDLLASEAGVAAAIPEYVSVEVVS